MSAADVSRRLTPTVRDGLSTFLGVAAVVAIALGLLYQFGAGVLPHLLQGPAPGGPQDRRAVLCLVAGGGSAVVAWLVRVRRPTSR